MARLERFPFHAWLLILWVIVLSFFFANLEIQIEGSAGWASNLPTWRIENHWLLEIFWGGRPITGYHVWAFSFMALVFHLPIFIFGYWTFRHETRILGCLMWFWIVEDFLWFVLNPSYGLSKFSPTAVSWHKHWFLGVPTDYITFTVLGAILFFYSFWRSKRRKKLKKVRRESWNP